MLQLVAGLNACQSCFDEKAFVERYFHEVYQPESLVSGHFDFPEEYIIKNLTWHCYLKNHLCQSSTLQMVAENHGIIESLDYFSFLLGYTYGATYVRGAGMFMPYSDPEPGFIPASCYLKLRRKYLVADNMDLLIDNIKLYLSKDYPVRIAWNSALTMKYAIESEYFSGPEGWKEPSKNVFSPHSVLFVGYDSASFYYYETHGRDFTLVGEKGIRIDKESAVEAISSFSTRYNLPWNYMLTIFEKDTTSINIVKIFERNGEEMIGRTFGPTSTGSYALKGLSTGVRKEGTKIFESPKIEMFKSSIETLMEIRRGNAIFLGQTFGDNNKILEISRLLHSSADNYQSIIAILDKADNTRNDVISICKLLDLSAETEESAGRIFISAAGNHFMSLTCNFRKSCKLSIDLSYADPGEYR